jgi:hypothetical protein
MKLLLLGSVMVRQGKNYKSAKNATDRLLDEGKRHAEK